jgi:hypothetical protein
VNWTIGSSAFVDTVQFMEQIPPPRRVIRLFPDYSRDYPLWENSTSTWDVGYTTTPETYGLSEQLGADLADWQAFWEAHADPFDGWDSDENQQTWLRDGEWLARRLQEEVQSFADVQREFGPHRDGASSGRS